jgi:hypothetical protein
MAPKYTRGWGVYLLNSVPVLGSTWSNCDALACVYVGERTDVSGNSAHDCAARDHAPYALTSNRLCTRGGRNSARNGRNSTILL